MLMQGTDLVDEVTRMMNGIPNKESRTKEEWEMVPPRRNQERNQEWAIKSAEGRVGDLQITPLFLSVVNRRFSR
jgi:hypothetical protein